MSLTITYELSKKVGWKKPKKTLKWPTHEEIFSADPVKLLTWFRFLPEVETKQQASIIKEIMGRLRDPEDVDTPLPLEDSFRE